jgi:hypothetical protein
VACTPRPRYRQRTDIAQDILARYEQLVKTHQEYVAAHQQERESSQAALQRVGGLQSSIDHLQRLLVRVARFLTMEHCSIEHSIQKD